MKHWLNFHRACGVVVLVAVTVAVSLGQEPGGERHSAESEAGTRKTTEDQAGERRTRDGEGNGSAPTADWDPQTAREAALVKLLTQLQREVTALRREVQSLKQAADGRDGDGRQVPRRGGGSRPSVSAAEMNKFRKQFQAYDKDQDGAISFQERLRMKNYEVTGTRLLTERLYHLHEDMNRDGGVSLEEFAAGRTRKGQRWLPFQLMAVDADAGQIHVQGGGGESEASGKDRSIAVEPKAVIVVKGREAKLSSLTLGQPIYVFFSHDETSTVGLTQR